MKKLIFILLLLPVFIYGQDDKIILNNGDTIFGNVIEVGVNSLTYQYKNEATNNIIKKRDVAKVFYSSGRIQEFKGLDILEFELKKQNKRIKKQKNRKPISGYGTNGSFWLSSGVGFTKNASNYENEFNPSFISSLIGLQYKLSINKKLNLDVLINYNRNKIPAIIIIFDAMGNNLGSLTTWVHKLNYINICPKIEIQISNNFNFLVGPSLGFVLNKSTNYTEEYKATINNLDWDALDENLNEDFKQYISNIDYGIKVGLSFYLTERIKLISDYKLSLSDLYKDTYNLDYFTQAIYLSLAYRL